MNNNVQASCRGFLLLEFSVILIIIGIFVTASLAIYKLSYIDHKYENVLNDLKKIQKSIEYFYFYEGRLPCPAPMIESYKKNYSHRELDCDAISQNFILYKNNKDFDLYINNEDQIIITGFLPTYDLNIPLKTSTDSWGREIIYRVVLDQTNSTKFGQNNGGIKIHNQHGDNINWDFGRAHYVLLSHGKNICSDTMLGKFEKENCSYSDINMLADFSSAENEMLFDDILLFEEFVRQPQEFGSTPCDVSYFFSEFNISENDYKYKLDTLIIDNQKTMRICNENLLRSMGFQKKNCQSFKCINGIFENSEMILH